MTPIYSMFLADGKKHYMTERDAPDARTAIRELAYDIDPAATSAQVEIIEVLRPDSSPLPGTLRTEEVG